MEPVFWLGIVVIILLVVTFFVSYVLNKKTPEPAGCEGIKISEEFCLQCTNTECTIRQRFDIQKIREELEKDMEEDV